MRAATTSISRSPAVTMIEFDPALALQENADRLGADLGDLAGHADHLGPDRRQVHGRGAVLAAAGREHRRHQGVGVEVAAEVERRPVVPRRPDGPQRDDVLAHPGSRAGPRHRIPVLDVGPDLRAQAEGEAATGELLEVVGHVGRRHGRAGEGDRDGGAEARPSSRRGGKRNGQEAVVVGLGDHQAVEARSLGFGRPRGRIGERSGEHGVEVHEATLPGPRPGLLATITEDGDVTVADITVTGDGYSGGGTFAFTFTPGGLIGSLTIRG